MARVLQLYNVFGAETEKVWLEFPLGLARKGHQLSFGYETVAEPSVIVPESSSQLRRITVTATSNPGEHMEQIATHVDDALLQRLLGEAFDLVHGHTGPRVLQGAAFLNRGVPMVVSLYGYDASRLLRDEAWVGRYRWAAGHGATFVVLCEWMRDRLLHMGLPPERVRIIHLGIDPKRWPYAQGAAPREARFVFIGRLIEKKGIGDLIQSLVLLRDTRRAAVHLSVIGDGPLEDVLKKQVAAAGLESQVRFIGKVPREAIQQYLRDATAFVLPSVTAGDGDSEGTPIVLMEAQAMGVPCVTTFHAGNPETICPAGQAFVVPPGRPRELADALGRCIDMTESKRQELQRDGRRWIEEHFTLASTIKQYDALYRELTTR